MMPEWHQLDSSITMPQQQEPTKKKTLKSSSRSFWFSTGLLCLCENNRIESWQIQMGENETLRFICLHMAHNIEAQCLSNSSLKLKLIIKTFKTNTLSYLKGSLISI